MIRAKFVVTQITFYESGRQYASVELQPRYSKTIPEDQRFAQATPNGILKMDITNPAVIDVLQPGKVVYIDIHEAPEGTSSYHE